MPYNYAHALAGMSACESCKNCMPVGEKAFQDAFFLGTMGPDPYYGDAYPPPLPFRARSSLADGLHALDGRLLFSRLFALCAGNETYTAYAMGFLAHVLLDNHVHPYIGARFAGPLHTPAEIAMDPMLVARAGEPRLAVSPAAFYKTDALLEIDALHTALVGDLLGEDARGVYARSLKKWLHLNAALYDPAGRKRRATWWLPALSRYFIAPREGADDLLNLTHAPWSASDARTASVPELFDEACAEIRLRIAQYYAGETDALLAALEGRSADAAGNVSE